jgi:hypothetical protein
MSKRKRRLESTAIGVVGLVLVFVGLNVQHPALLGYGLEHLGVVLVVGLFIKIAIEEASQREFLGVVNEQVKMQIQATTAEVARKSIEPLEADIKRLATNLTFRIANLFNEDLRKELDRTILNPTFVRPQYTLNLKLKPLSPNNDLEPGLLNVVVGISYEIKNVSSDPAEYSVQSWVDDVIPKPSGICCYTGVAYGGKKSGLRAYDIKALEKSKEIVHGNGVVSLKLRPETINPACSLFVEIEAAQLMRTEDHFVWNLIGLTERLDVVVELEGGLTFDKFDVFPRELHHLGPDAFRAKIKPESDVRMTMSIDQVLLPYQGIELRWAPRAGAS